MGDIPDQLYGIINNLLGIVDTLQLCGFIQVDQVFIEVEPGCGKERSCIIMEVSCNALPFFFLKADGSIKQGFLLILLHTLQLLLVADDFSLVKSDKDDKANRECQHPDSTKEQYGRDPVIRAHCL